MAPRHSLPESFAFAWNGLAEGALRDRNLRIHLALGVLAGVFAARAPLAPAERALLVLCIALVVAAESMNSALEAVVNLAAPGLDERARIAKDAAAGAVLAVAGGSVLVLAVAAAPRLGALAAAAPVHAVPIVGAVSASVATLLLPAPFERSAYVDGLLAAAGLAGLVLAGRGAATWAGVAASAACLAIAGAGAAKRRNRAGGS
ncbi:MAG TPA: diacylglycerol kinase [Anaeromyxobacter sp.]